MRRSLWRSSFWRCSVWRGSVWRSWVWRSWVWRSWVWRSWVWRSWVWRSWVSRRRVFLAAALFAPALSVAACAPALPTLAGGRTTPTGRTDLALGGAVRVPVGDLVAQPGDLEGLTRGAPGGAVPVAQLRHGVNDDVDLGLEVAGALMRLSARGRIRLGTVDLLGGIVPHGGLVDLPVRAGRIGAQLPLLVVFEMFSVMEGWLGVRAAVEHVFGDDDGGVSLTGVRTGGVVGVAVGFRRFHVLVELGVDHELWTGAYAGEDVERSGVALTPAFALRLRL